MKIVKKIKMTATMTVITGLHIGGSKESVEIGGIDSPVIKVATKKGQPYIPGSSLKGKMRCLLEQVSGATSIGDNPRINNIFGFAKDKQPSKIIFRDAYLTDKSVRQLESCDDLDMPFTENKFENSIDRIKGVASNPRQIERVPAGAEFLVEIIINIWDDDNEKDVRDVVNQGIKLIESDYLGGSGSRGYGQVKFSDFNVVELSPSNNWNA